MRILNRIALAVLAVAFTLGLVGPDAAFAATTPSLGMAATYGVLAGTYTNTVAGTTVNGDIGFTTGPAVVPAGTHTNYGSGAPTPTARVNAASALTALAAQPCTFTFANGPINLSTDTTHGPIGVYTPGVYCSNGAVNIGGPITLNGSGTYIFRVVGALTSTAGSIVTLSGASACNVFWTPTQATTLGANTIFAGTIIDNANAITVGANTTWSGRALSLGAGTVTTATDTITVPSCTVTPTPTPTPTPGLRPTVATVTVVKNVINDGGGTKTVADFPLYFDGMAVKSGVTYTWPVSGSVSTVTETADPGYVRTFSGDCDATGRISLAVGDAKVCVVTNNDVNAPAVVPPVPPLIDVVKVPDPLALPGGPGAVTYTYTLKNVGTVPVTDVTMVGDSCSPINLVSGDVDSDSKLDTTETWVYRCTRNLSETHTNTVVATGWANGISATDIASATVVVGLPTVPPLIHVTKIPSPLTLVAGGGEVTYTNKVTNPGTVPLENVRLTDDKCSLITYVSGDTNGDSKLDTTETWTYTCKANLTQTTVNTVLAAGDANGLTARDFAIASVVVATAAPALPNTGFGPALGSSPWILAVAVMLAVSALLVAVIQRKRLS